MSGVKNIGKYQDMSVEELTALGTRTLLAVLESSRGRAICSCGKGYHCGDDVLSKDEREWNAKNSALGERVREILATRPHLETRKPKHRKEKKGMRY